MAENDVNNIACQIIAYAGDAKSMFLEALDAADSGEVETADKMMKDGGEAIVKAHEIHTKLLVMEAQNSDSVKMTLMLVHASNHLAIAEATQNFSEKLLKIYKRK